MSWIFVCDCCGAKVATPDKKHVKFDVRATLHIAGAKDPMGVAPFDTCTECAADIVTWLENKIGRNVTIEPSELIDSTNVCGGRE